MDQTRFDVFQSSLEVASELQMPSFLRQSKGEQFILSLIVEMRDGAIAPLDIYADRIPVGERVEVHQIEGVAKIVSTTASLESDGERFRIFIALERSDDHSSSRPFIWVSPDMVSAMERWLERREKQVVEDFLTSIEQDTTEQ